MRRHPKVEDDEGQLPGGGTVFRIGRRKTQGQLAKAELNQGIDHLRQAASYAAKGAGATVGPRVQAARVAVAPTAVMVRDRASSGVASSAAALAPVLVAVRQARTEAAGKALSGRKAAAAKQAAMTKKAKNMKPGKKKQRRSRGMTTGLLIAGAVAGLAAAMAMRRRREQQEWAEYDPTGTLGATGQGALEPMREDVDTIVVETPEPTAKVTQAGPAGAGSSAVADGSSSSTTPPAGDPVIHPNSEVPSVAEGARDVTGRPADDVTKAAQNGRSAAKASGRR
ncbi:hypothetical protein [Micromonospora sp. WMMD975]|uniref:hypothetical protein n=1 Tax=Micromonospora sp. WMMD975 TaxID=3016087 RepID=UPI00249ADD69|nr:hypothetical protein [Micromonospora sp. WMMD975]WFE32774.1 hypothetical protein O7613_24990 [Micromonospora sp. WMMD975]